MGSHLLRSFADRGHRVVAFGRDRLGVPPAFEFRSYDLDRGLPAAALTAVDVLIHGAFIPAVRTEKDAAERNIRATRDLSDAARMAGAKFVFLSTLSARPEAKSRYGIHKYASELMLADSGALIIRPGLVVGDGGLIRSLFRSLRSGIVPLIDAGTQSVQVVGTEDLAMAIGTAIAGELRGRHNVCATEAVSIAEMARSLGERFHLRPRYITVPWAPAYAVARLAERLGITLPLTTESLLGLRTAQYESPSAAFLKLNWNIRAWPELIPSLSFALGST